MPFTIKPDRKETENKTIRFPVDTIEKINAAIINKEVTFSGFVIQVCEYALNNMEHDADYIVFASFNGRLLFRTIISRLWLMCILASFG